MSISFKYILSLFLFFLASALSYSVDLYYSNISIVESINSKKYAKSTILKILKLAEPYDELICIDEFIFPGYISCHYDSYSNTYFTVDGDKITYKLEQKGDRFVFNIIDSFPKKEIIIDDKTSPHKIYLPFTVYPIRNMKNNYYLFNYYFQHKYPRGASNFGIKFVEIIDSEFVIHQSFILPPHLGFEKEQQYYLNEPVWLDNNSIIYSDSRYDTRQTYIYNYNDNNIDIIEGNLLGVSYMGDKFIISNNLDTFDNNKIEVFDSNMEPIQNLSKFQYLKDTFIKNDLLVSMYLWEPGLIPIFGTPFLIYDLSIDKTIFYDENFDLLNYGNVDEFVGFY